MDVMRSRIDGVRSTAGLGALIYLAIRAVSLATAAILLPRGAFADRHWSFARWIIAGDYGHYRDIALHGYAFNHADVAHASVFAWYPGYPAAIDTLRWIPGLGTARSAFIVTLVAGLIAAAGVATLTAKLTGDARVSLIVVAIWAAAPGSLALSMLYSEALFCALAAWALVALVERRWLTAGLLTALAGTVHSTALALVAAVATAAGMVFIDRPEHESAWRPVAAAVIAPLGLLCYWAYVAIETHKITGWFWIERHTCHIAFDAGRSTLRLAAHTFMTGPTPQLLLIFSVLAVAIALAAVSVSSERTIPLPVHAYTIAIVLLAAGVSSNWVGAKPRLLLPAFLLALPLARPLARMRSVIAVPILTALAIASMWLGLYLLVIVRWAP